MQQNWKATISTAIDWLGYIGLLSVGIYFILEAEVLQRYQLGRTNFAEYEESISERPTIVTYFEPGSTHLKYGVDYNISYQVYSQVQEPNVQEFNLTHGQNQVAGEGVFDFEEIGNGLFIKLTPTTPPNKHNRLQGIRFTFDPLKEDIFSKVTIVVKLSCENNSIAWLPNEHIDGKPSYYQLNAGIRMITTLSVEKKVYMSKACRKTPFNQLILSRLTEDVMKNCTEKCRQEIHVWKSLDKFISGLPICKNKEQAKCAEHTLTKILETTKVEKPCTVLQYRGSSTKFKTSNNTANFWYRFYGKGSHVDVKEEYLILDLVAMVGSVGGTLGLCIGFSFSDCFGFFTNQFTQIIRRLKKVRDEENATDYATKEEVNELREVLLKSVKSEILRDIHLQIHPQMKIQCLEEK